MQALQEIISTAKNPLYSVDLSDEEKIKRLVDRDNEEEGNLNEADGYNCPLCKNRGVIFSASKETDICGQVYYREISEECKCMKTRRSIRRMKKSGLESVIGKYTFSAFIPKEEWQKAIKDRAQNFAETIADNDKWFFVGGAVGSGKSHICTAISRELLLQGYEVIYMLWVDDSQKLKSLVTEEEEYGRRIDKLKNVDVLYIDDFFKINPTSADIKLAYEILNYRYQNPQLITILSSEKLIGEIEELDSAIGSRIFEKARNYLCNIARLKGRNYRMREVELI